MQAYYFDGKKSGKKDVKISILPYAISFSDSKKSIKEEWKIEDIKIVTKPEYGREAMITSKNNEDARLIISKEIYDKLAPILPRSITKFNLPNPKISLFIGAILAIIFLFFTYNNIPFLARKISKIIPYSWSDNLGRITTRAIHSNYDLCENEAGLKALRKIVDPLQKSANIEGEIHLYVLKEDMPNAFAAMGNHVTILSGLINSADSEDEIAGVLAHELSHSKLKHPEYIFTTSVGSYFLLNMMFGNTGAEELILVGNSLKQLQYSREIEEEADDFALKILENTNFDPNGLAIFFQKLEKIYGFLEKGEIGGFLSYLSTHPKFKDRIQKIETSNLPLKNTKKYLTEKEFQDLKNICN